MADFHGTQEVVTDLREDGVLIMRINRPEKRNAINAVTSAAMEDIMNKAEKDKRVRVIVVTGTGEKAFCAGEDLSELSSGGECMTVTDHGFGGITDRLCPKPTICAVNGVAAGGGMEIAVSCDIVVAAEHARFGLTEPKVGLIASTGGLVRMARDVPRKAAMDMLLTARLVHADEAKEIGFVNYVVPAEELMDKALEIVNYCLTKYEYAVANQPQGQSYYECYDRKTGKPSAEWVEIDNKVREDLRRFGLKI